MIVRPARSAGPEMPLPACTKTHECRKTRFGKAGIAEYEPPV